MSKKKVAVLGGGPAGLAAAFRLSEGDRFDVTVYQLGWRCGGSCATGWHSAQHVIEHSGPHSLFGCFHESIGLLRQAYVELQRRGDERFGTFEQQLVRRSTLVMKQWWQREWRDWVVRFPEVELGRQRQQAPLPADFVINQIVTRTLEFVQGGDLQSLLADPAAFGGEQLRPALQQGVFRSAEQLAKVRDTITRRGSSDPLFMEAGAWSMRAMRGALQVVLRSLGKANLDAERAWILLDLGLTCCVGLLSDRALGADWVARLDGLDLRAWLLRHGLEKAHAESSPVRIWYQLMAAYEGGRPDRPSCAAGAALSSAMQILFNYEGAFSFQLKNEVGDSFIAPLVAALQHRGVRFAYFHRLWDLIPDGRGVARVVLERQAEVRDGALAYQPFVEQTELTGEGASSPVARSVWPAVPRREALARVYVDEAHPELVARERALDNFWCPRCGPERVLEEGVDYDALVLAVTGATLRWYTRRLQRVRPAWRDLAENVGAVETQGLRFWFGSPPSESGCATACEPGPVLTSGYLPPFCSWVAASSALASQSWPEGVRPSFVAHLSGPLESSGDWPAPEDFRAGNAYLVRQRERADEDASCWSSSSIAALWPGFAMRGDPNVLDLSHCARDPESRANAGPAQASLHVRPGTWRYRLRSDEPAGFDNLFTASDWAAGGFPCGSVEAAVASGLCAAGEVARRFGP